MNELVQRYVQQVGRYLPKKDRAEIEAELHSLIQDKLDDRYGGAPSQTELVAVLKELGAPYKMAASYGSQQYLIGPDLYPFMMMVLRYGWLVIPTIVVFVNVFAALTSSEPTNVLSVIVGSLLGAVQATFFFSGVVVIIFAVIQHSNVQIDEKEMEFDPLKLPAVDDPSSVDRVEATFGIALGTLFMLVFMYFLNVGGLTLRFNLNDPGDVIAAPVAWLVLLNIANIGMIVMQILALRRNRWNIGMWLVETVFEVFSTVALYFAVFRPLFEHFTTTTPSLLKIPLFDKSPEIVAVSFAVITLIGRGSRLITLWNYHNGAAPLFSIKAKHES
ncbi:MAG: hypothetical protein KF716_27115 [Anaerolineae bacterium]|nr:hypothetical protein [Anaerolineae bacterium]